GVNTHLEAVRLACDEQGLELDVIGTASGTPAERPEAVLGAYDLVFAKARCALEALAVGTAVVLCDYAGRGPMVTSGEVALLRRQNFGRRVLTGPLDADALVREIDRYDPDDAAAASNWIREEASLERSVERLLVIYQDAISEQAMDATDSHAELRSLAEYLRAWGPQFKNGPLHDGLDRSRHEVDRLTLERNTLQAARDELAEANDRLDREL